MNIYYKVLTKIRNNKTKFTNIGGIVTLAFGLRYGKINSIPTNFSLNYIQQVEKVHNFLKEDLKVIKTEVNVIKTGDMLLISNQQIYEGSKSALRIRSGDVSKSNADARAKADARRNAKAGKWSSGSIIIPGTEVLLPQNTYCRYHQNAPSSCRVKITPDPFPGGGNNHQPPYEGSNFDESQYKGGSSPFIDKFDYNNLNHSRENVDFSNKKRMSHSYDGHAKKWISAIFSFSTVGNEKFP